MKLRFCNISRLAIVVLMVFSSVQSFSQEGGVGGGIVAFNYSMGFTIGGTRTYINEFSGRGANLDIRFNPAKHISVGALVGWNYFYKRQNRTIYKEEIVGGTVQVSAVQFRYLNVIPLMLQAFYTFNDDIDGVKPYVGLAIGGSSVDYEKYWSNILDENESWEFSVSPSVGVCVPFG